MITFDRLLGAMVLIWVLLQTVSFGTWTWKRNNKLGAIALFIVALAAIALPIYSVFFMQ